MQHIIRIMENNKGNKDRKEKILCEICNTEYMKCNKSHHNKSKKHKNNEKDIELKRLSTVENLNKAEIKDTLTKEKNEIKNMLKEEMSKKIDELMDSYEKKKSQ